MPDQWERHGKANKWGYDDWDSIPSRSQQRQAAANDDPVRDRVPGKKNKDACKANHWGPHTPNYVFFRNPWRTRAMTNCGWSTVYRNGQFTPTWYCGHSGRCTACGKRLWKPPVCPTRTRDDIEPPVWIVEQAKEETREYLARRAKWMPRRVIKGPSHYRKPKAR
jgi:hypothetical protein